MSLITNYPYLYVLIIFVFIPSIVIWLIHGRYLFRYPKTFLYNTAFGIIWGLIFDIVASPLMGVWGYDYTLFTAKPLGLPFEEYLFLLFVPQLLTSLLLLLRRKLHHG